MIVAGFEDPVTASQQTFRAVLAALARPGTIATLPAPLGVPAGLAPASAAIILTLLDFEMTVCLGGTFADRGDVTEFIRFQTGVRIVKERATASFALVDLATDELDLARYCQGDPAYPDRSTTVIAQVVTLVAAGSLRLAGPGLAREHRLSFSPMPVDFLAQWAANRRPFPLGVDLILVCGHQAVALPRTVRIIDRGE